MHPLVRMTGITKRFGASVVLQDVDFELRAGEVHVLAGENGAGKSTLIKILGGVHADYEGALQVDGRVARLRTPRDASALGIAVIFQELSLVPSLSVADNLFLGRPLAPHGFVDDRAQRAQAQQLLRQFGIEIDVARLVEELPLAQQQLVEIAKALACQARVLVMDEPTSALHAPEVEKLFGLIRELQARGCGIVYITHKMEEIERLADRITVLRDGRCVGTAAAAELPPAKLVQWMVGREMREQFPRHAATPGAERLRLENFSVFRAGSGARSRAPSRLPPDARDVRAGGRAASRAAPHNPLKVVDDVSLSVHAGEIVGVAGLQGSGSSELFLALVGGHAGRVEGRALLHGAPLHIASPRTAIAQGVALLTSDRKTTGLVLPLSVTANATLADLPRLSPGGWRRPARERAAAARHAGALALRAASLDLEVEALSGGNQQKVALAKWLQTEPQLLLLDEPTRGIDVAAKREVYALLNDLTARGIAILLITSELPELLALSDRIVVLHRGRVTASLNRDETTAEKVMEAAMGKREKEVIGQ
jgi:ABC-type sugar transport system ATPase subunit